MTSQDTEQFRLFLSQLQREDHRPAALNELKNLLVYKPAGEAATTIRNVGISKLVQCLKLTDKTQFDLTCEVLKICFEKFEPGEVIKNYTSHIMYLLRHEKSCVRKIAVEEVYKSVSFDNNLLDVTQYVDVFVAVAQQVIDPDIAIANKAILVTSSLPFEAYPKVLEEMKIALEYGVSSKCNAFEVVINISAKSYELFQLSAENGYFESMVSDLQTDDILYQLNILELLSRLSGKPYGIVYLVKQGALEKISNLVTELPNNPMSGLLIPGYIKFFGCLAHHYPLEIFEKYPPLIDLILESLENGDPTVLPVTLDTLGFVGCTVEGKLCLAALGRRYTEALEVLYRFIKNSPVEVKVRAIHCFANLIGVDKDPTLARTGPVDHRITLMTREWFRSFSNSPTSTEYLNEICKNPFSDIRLAALALLDAICQHQWGEELVARTAGFIEYLLDRSVDHTKESKEAKYDIIKKLSRSAAFDANIITRLQTYVEQGPFFSESGLEVAMEEGD